MADLTVTITIPYVEIKTENEALRIRYMDDCRKRAMEVLRQQDIQTKTTAAMYEVYYDYRGDWE